MQNPQFGGSILVGEIDIAAANTATDGSGTINVLLTGAGKFALGTVTNTSANTINVSNWSSVSDPTIGIIKNGDIISLVSTGGVPTGLSINTDYIITELSVSSNTATFKLLNTSTFTLIPLTSVGTTPHIWRFPSGTRVDEINFINSQATAAASSANVYKIFMKNRNSSTWFPLREMAVLATTRSTSVIGVRQTFSFVGGLFIPEGAQLGATIAVYAGVQDRTSAYAVQATNF